MLKVKGQYYTEQQRDMIIIKIILIRLIFNYVGRGKKPKTQMLKIVHYLLKDFITLSYVHFLLSPSFSLSYPFSIPKSLGITSKVIKGFCINTSMHEKVTV